MSKPAHEFICRECGEQGKDGTHFEEGFLCCACENGDDDCGPSDDELIDMFGFVKESQRMR